MVDLKFINDVIKPWDELNQLLSLRFAFQPELSDVTRMTASLAVFINHYGEPEISPAQTATESFDMKIIGDVADASKHFKLRDTRRQNDVSVRAFFEGRDDGEFRFLRNSVLIDHATEGELDFLKVSLSAIRYWIEKLGLDVGEWQGEVMEGPPDFYPTAWLNYEAKYCIRMGGTNYRLLKRDGDSLQPFDPPNWTSEIYVDGELGARAVVRDGQLIK